jgi:uncharacterized protein YkwD
MTWWQWLRSLFTRPKPRPAPPPAPVVSLLDAINAARRINGLPMLISDTKLDLIAQGWAETMARDRMLSHGNFAARLNAIYPGRTCAENIAEGRSDAAAVVTDWLASPGHRANLLGPYTSVGCGRSGTFWVADFLA